jgi:excinuclease UvrABC ATPase subunit
VTAQVKSSRATIKLLYFKWHIVVYVWIGFNHQAIMARADWIIDLGPGAGHDGGRIVFEGTPAELVAARSTLTGQHLAEYVSG